MNKLNFVIAGVAKCGTTSLHNTLAKHPEICMSEPKELGFFDKNEYFLERNVANSGLLDMYMYFNFRPTNKTKMFGESSPMYFVDYNAIERLYHYNPNMKFILIFRNPIERAYSHWRYQVQEGVVKESPFREALEDELKYPTKYIRYRLISYIQWSRYIEYLRFLWRFFAKEQILCLKYEDLFSTSTLPNNILKFLNVDSDVSLLLNKDKVTQNKGSISEIDREFLSQKLKYSVHDLAEELHWDLQDWIKND